MERRPTPSARGLASTEAGDLYILLTGANGGCMNETACFCLFFYLFFFFFFVLWSSI